MRIVCWQTILFQYHTLFFVKIGKDVAKFVVCCSRDWRFKGSKSVDQQNYSPHLDDEFMLFSSPTQMAASHAQRI